MPNSKPSGSSTAPTPRRAAYVDVGLFAFNQLKRVQVQLALPKAQLKRELKRPHTRIVLGP